MAQPVDNINQKMSNAGKVFGNNSNNSKYDPKKDPHYEPEYNFDFDELKMYFGEPYELEMPNGEFLLILQPSIGDIMEFGDIKLYSAITPITGNTTTYRVQLWDNGQDWNKIKNFELFAMLSRGIKDVELLFKKIDIVENPDYDDELSEEDNLKNGQIKLIKIYSDINFENIIPCGKAKIDEDGNPILDKDGNPEQEMVLYIPDQEVYIDEKTYIHIREYVRFMFNQHPKEELAKGKTAKEWLIENDKEESRLAMEKKGSKSPLIPLVSGLLNHPGFKYDLEGMKKLGIFAFMDSVNRLQLYENCTATLNGMYSGMADYSKVGAEEINKRINWLQDIYEK